MFSNVRYNQSLKLKPFYKKLLKEENANSESIKNYDIITTKKKNFKKQKKLF